jgi:hypothetical protein
MVLIRLNVDDIEHFCIVSTAVCPSRSINEGNLFTKYATISFGSASLLSGACC